MQLSFWAKGTALVPHIGAPLVVGAHMQFVGREWSAEHHGYPAVDTPTVVESSSEDGEYLTIIARRDSDLLPADPETAAFVGVPFVPHKAVDGVMTKIDIGHADAPTQ